MAIFSKELTKRLVAGTALSILTLGAGAKDNVIMTVGGVDVPTSEFEYLYHKNSQQQLTPQTLEEYLEMFKLYRMKVAEALAEKLDTTENFRKEMAQYREELARPYLTDSAYLYKLVDEAFERASYEQSPSHIMILKTRDEAVNRRRRQTADSVLNELRKGADFRQMVSKHSMDHQIADSTGNLGFFGSNMLPYAFEVAAFNTPEGQFSEVVESPAGYHIIMGGPKRPWQGKVLASHIMKMVRPNASEEDEAKAKHQIDSLYAVVKVNPSLFSEVAKNNSDDPGSARDGGRLPWFGTHEMVPEFEKAAFALQNGEISEPVRSQYGWHIILKSDSKTTPEYADIKKFVLARSANSNDPRYEMIRNHQVETLSKKHNASINAQTRKMLEARVGHEGLDSTFWVSLTKPDYASTAVATIDGNNVAVADFAKFGIDYYVPQNEDEIAILDRILNDFYRNQLVKAEEDWLYANEPDYHNLLKEYHDGSLLYEVSLRNVWNKASKDTEGLEKYFEANRDSYSWTEPRAKGFLIQAVNDSVGARVIEKLNKLPKDSVLIGIRKEFKNNVKIDKYLVPQGVNAMVDQLAFNGPKVKPDSDKYTVFFLWDNRIITKPEEASDVRGQVTSDYQNALEEKWVESLKQKYPVKVNKKELKKVK